MCRGWLGEGGLGLTGLLLKATRQPAGGQAEIACSVALISDV